METMPKADKQKIIQQERIRNDIYNILVDLGLKAQSPSNVAINTDSGHHKVFGYPFDKDLNNFGKWQYSINIEIETDYRFEQLKLIVETEALKQIENNNSNLNSNNCK